MYEYIMLTAKYAYSALCDRAMRQTALQPSDRRLAHCYLLIPILHTCADGIHSMKLEDIM